MWNKFKLQIFQYLFVIPTVLAIYYDFRTYSDVGNIMLKLLAVLVCFILLIFYIINVGEIFFFLKDRRASKLFVIFLIKGSLILIDLLFIKTDHLSKIYLIRGLQMNTLMAVLYLIDTKWYSEYYIGR